MRRRGYQPKSPLHPFLSSYPPVKDAVREGHADHSLRLQAGTARRTPTRPSTLEETLSKGRTGFPPPLTVKVRTATENFEAGEREEGSE